MRTIGNIIWIIFGRLITAIGTPLGVQLLKMAKLSLMPFGSSIVDA